MTTLPATITKSEETQYDQYKGPLADLIAAGLVREDQLPPAGKFSISWRNGVYQPRRCKQDEHYVRVVVYDNGDAVVQIGVTAEVAAPRKAAARLACQQREAEYRARSRSEEEAKKAKERAADAERAKRDLKLAQDMKSERNYRCHLAKHIRQSVHIWLGNDDAPSTWHGHRLTTEGLHSIMIAADAMVEAMMQAEVIFDAELHKKVVAGLTARVRAADPLFYAQLDKLSTPNPSILEGEAS